jgi:hypothetical protein
MTRLYEAFLPLVQSLNDYGGNFTSFHIRERVLDAIDVGAGSDPSLAALRDKLHDKMAQWKGLQDHKTISELFEAYYEAVFYLTAVHRGVSLCCIPACSKKGKTPDFTSTSEPTINFEVKTIDVADPKATYDRAMAEGLDAKLEAQALAKQNGVGVVGRTISPHGSAGDRRGAVEQVMKKIDSNVKAGQYAAAPTFLVVSAVRSALHERAENLRRWLPWPGHVQNANGQLFAVAAHQIGEPFYFFPEWGREIVNLGAIGRAGILLDHPYIAGLIFVVSEWRETDKGDLVFGVYSLNGIWNNAWEGSASFGPEATTAAKKAFEQLCHHWNDTDDSRSSFLPTA